MNTDLQIIHGDARTAMVGKVADASVHCCVTSPPFWGLRKYLKDGDPNQRFEIGQEKTPEEYVANIVAVMAEVWRVLRDDGTLWLNLGDSYAGGGSFANDGPRMTRLIGTDKNVPARKGSRGVTVKSKRIPRGSGRWGGGDLAAPGLKAKDLVGIPWRVAFALQAAGWYLRQDIIWHKPNPMPESVTDRCTKAHEYIFLLSKSERYYFDNEAISEPAIYGDNGSTFDGDRDKHVRPNTGKKRRTTVARGGFNGKTNELEGREAFRAIKDTRNKRDVWTCSTQPYREAHFATYPPALIRPCIRAGCPLGGTVLDPFGGSGTTGQVALEEGRKAVLVELNGEYHPLIRQRTTLTPGLQL